MKGQDDEFRLRIAPPRSRGRRTLDGFTTRILRALSKANGGAPWTLRHAAARTSPRTRGGTAARLLKASGAGRRRVVVKLRLAHHAVGSRSSEAALRYISRDGVARDGTPGRAYGPATGDADLAEFEVRSHEDRHQFRLIVAPEDAAELQDLQAFTREVMTRVESDLGTRLDWVAVDHWDTDNPHTHVVLRGRDDCGKDLVIAPAYISHGLRMRAESVALEWLGPRTEREIEAAVSREVVADRWTTLDRHLSRLAREGVVDGTVLPARQRPHLVGRLQHLEALGLAQQGTVGRWHLQAGLEATLRTLGERGDIVRSMQRQFRDHRECVIHGRQPIGEVVGRILGLVVVDDTRDRAALLIDGIDGRAHAVLLTARVDARDYPLGAIVRFAAKEASIADRSIAELARDGIYRTSRERIPKDATNVQKMQVRRLEALRRAGIVERIADGVWRVPQNVVEQGKRFDRGRDASSIEVLSRLSIERQQRAIGATWLDEQIASGRALAPISFGAEVQSAARVRIAFLIDHGYLKRDVEGHAPITRATLARLRAADVARAREHLAATTGMPVRELPGSVALRGRYREALWLASGRYAVIEQQGGLGLVPWKPVLEGRLGQVMSIVMDGDRCDFSFAGSRSRGR